MNKKQAVNTIRVWLRPSNPTITVTGGLYEHRCKNKQPAIKFVEAVLILDGEIISQTTGIDVTTVAKLPPSAISLVTPGRWGGSMKGSVKAKKEGGAIHKLDLRVAEKTIRELNGLVAKYGIDKSKTVRRLIEEAAEREGILL